MHSDDIHVTLEVEAFPQVDEQLSLAGGAPQQRVTTHALVLKKGETSKAVLVEVAGEHRLRLSEPSDRSVDVMATARVLVAPAKAVSLDLSNIPEAGKAGLDLGSSWCVRGTSSATSTTRLSRRCRSTTTGCRPATS